MGCEKIVLRQCREDYILVSSDFVLLSANPALNFRYISVSTALGVKLRNIFWRFKTIVTNCSKHGHY